MDTAIDRMRERVRDIYRHLTGLDLNERGGEPIPPGWDPAQFVRTRWLELERLVQMLGLPVAPPWTPRLDVIERERELEFQLEVPGVGDGDLSVFVEQGRLIVEGRRGPDKATGNGNGFGYRWREIPSGLFRREIPLPPGLRADKLDHELDNGILRVRLPHLRAAKTEVH